MPRKSASRHAKRPVARRSSAPRGVGTAKRASQLLRRTRECGWLLYITEGYVANLRAAIARNAKHLTPRDRAIAEQMLQRADQTAYDLRRELAWRERGQK